MDETKHNQEHVVESDHSIEPCLTKVQIAKILNVSARTLHRMVDRGEFPAPIKCGRQSRWLPQQIREHLKKAQTNAEKRRRK